MDDQAPTRREFLERALDLAAFFMVSRAGNLLADEPPSRLMAESDRRLPTTADVQRKNLTYLLLDLELAYGRNGAIPFTGEPQTRGLCLARFEHIADVFSSTTGFGWMRQQPHRFNGLRTQEVEGVLLALDRAIQGGGLHPPPREEVDNVDFLTPGLLHGSVDCDIYSFVALGIAERYGIPLYGVQSPGHFFTRWQSPLVRLNFDQGRIREGDDPYIDGSFVNDFTIDPLSNSTNHPQRGISQESLSQGVYLRTLSKRETVASHLATIASGLIRNQENRRALSLTTLATMWAPQDVTGHLQRAVALHALGRYAEEDREYRQATTLDSMLPARMYHLGL